MVALFPWMPAAIVLSGLVSGCVLWLFFRMVDHGQVHSKHKEAGPDSFLFRNGTIVDHTLRDPNEQMGFLDKLSKWTGFSHWLGDRFTNLPSDLSVLKPGERATYRSRNPKDSATVTISADHGGHLVALTDPHLPRPSEWHNAIQKIESSGVLAKGAEAAPCAMCMLDQQGQLTWQNAAFRQFSKGDVSRLLEAVGQSEHKSDCIVALENDKNGKPRHFELRSVSEKDHRVLYATDVTRLVQADTVRGAFIQTLTKTFADLATGLAVFDRHRQLVLFNPAMIDLTGLTAEFLSARPNLMEFFDRLRDKQVLPEPKNYGRSLRITRMK